MTEERARTVANVMMAAAVLGAAVIVLRSPGLRRTAWQVARYYATGPLLVWGATLVHDAWQESAARTSGSVAVSGHPVARR